MGVKEEIDEPVKVVASFNGAKIKIHFFDWRSRVYQVNSVNLFHIAKDGDRPSYNFSVSAEGNSYQIAFDPYSLSWRLVDIVSLGS